MVLTFWTSWCVPCQDQLGALNTIVSTIKKDDLVVFGINSEPSGVAARYLGAKQLSIPSLVDKDGRVMGIFGASSIPVTLIIDRGGKLVARFDGTVGESELRAALKQAGIE
jgi:thioredoxin-like negative regulator of GroEL